MKRNQIIILIYALISLGLAIGAWVLAKDNINKDTYSDEYVEESLPLAVHHFISNWDSEIETTEKFDKTIRQFMRRYNIVGASVAIMKNDSLIYAKGYGYGGTIEYRFAPSGYDNGAIIVTKSTTSSGDNGTCKLRHDGLVVETDTFGGYGPKINFKNINRY